jgi:DNA-binding IclR family transcriptional regulator
MYRLLKKMTELGYVDYSPAEATYVVSERLAMLGERLADAGCRTPQLRKLMSKIRTATGATVTLWVRTSLTVRLAAVLVGEVPGITSKAAGEIATPFSTPGLAIASRYRRDELRLLITQCRRKQIELGRKYAHVTDIEQALRDVRNRGFAMGYNLRGDGWGMLAWPLDIVTNPLRIGALAIGAPVATLRRDESKVVSVVEKLISEYVEQQVRDSAFDL